MTYVAGYKKQSQEGGLNGTYESRKKVEWPTTTHS